jgi:hypothetical protein
VKDHLKILGQHAVPSGRLTDGKLIFQKRFVSIAARSVKIYLKSKRPPEGPDLSSLELKWEGSLNRKNVDMDWKHE